MSRRPQPARVATVLVVLASLLLAGPGAPPAAASSCDGVWVVVDARAAGGTVTTRCAPGDPATGLAALERAGHAYTFVPRVPGMVCTIDARPEPCNGAPADAYWSYWYAEAGGAWSYASVGAGSRNPAPGSVEGWRFGDGSAPPGVAPPAPAPAPSPEPAPEPAPAPNPSPEPTTPPASDPAPSADPDPSPTDPGPSTGNPSSSVAPDTSPSGTSSGRPGAASDAVGDGATDPADREDGAPPGTSDAPVDAAGSDGPDPEPGAPGTSRNQDSGTTDESGGSEGFEATTDDLDTALAASRTDTGRTLPTAALLATGLLAGIGALTWRQRRHPPAGGT